MNTITHLRPAARTPHTPARSMNPTTAAIHSEWIKLRSVRSTPAFVALAGVLGVAMAFILGKLVVTDPYEHLPFTIANTALVSTWLTTLLAMVAGTLLFTSEAQHGTLAGAFTARPARRVVVTAKTVVAAALGLTMGAIGIAGSLVGGFVFGIDMGDTAGLPTGTAWALVLTTLAPVLGLGVGMIVRHSAAAVTGVLVWATAVENLVRGMAPATVSRLMPFSAANGLLGTRSATDTDATLAVALSNPGNAALFAAYALSAVAIGWWMTTRKDA